MTFSIRELSRAKNDKGQIFEWLHERSRAGAIAWLVAYDELVERLKSDANVFPAAQEIADLDVNVREALFRTRRGRFYRALFLIEQNTVFILRIRGPGQPPVDTHDIEMSR